MPYEMLKFKKHLWTYLTFDKTLTTMIEHVTFHGYFVEDFKVV